MTSLVGIRCKNGIVIGADSSITDGFMEQRTNHKIKIIGDEVVENRVIIAGSGYVGHGQRFVHKIERSLKQKIFDNIDRLEFSRRLSLEGIDEFASTDVAIDNIAYEALIAYATEDKIPSLVHLPPDGGMFQPMLIGEDEELWFTSAGSGGSITDTLLAWLSEHLWGRRQPDLGGGIFTALCALEHVCEINPGGIAKPIKIAVLENDGTGDFRGRHLTDDELEGEHLSAVRDFTGHVRQFMHPRIGTPPPRPPGAKP